MAPPRRRLARPVSSRRYLALRHGRAILRAHEQAQIEHNSPHVLEKEQPLGPGFARLHSADVPGLQAGTYTIEAKQTIEVNSKDLSRGSASPTTRQEFEVQAPRFTLPPDAVYSTYPAQGHSATVDCLPHVVFNDPELPWERVGSWDSEDSHGSDWDRNRVPWLAVVPFTQDELKLAPDELAAILAKTSLKDGKAAQTESLAVDVPNADLLSVKSANVPVPYSQIDSTTESSAKMIFVKPTLFNALFSHYDEKGAVIPRKGSKDQKPAPTVSQHRFLSHVRTMNTEGMAHADEIDEPVDRDFSVVLSHRTGPFQSAAGPDKAAETQTIAVHLVSIEGIEQMRPFPFDPQQVTRVGLVSLHSWTYECLPPGSIGPADALTALGQSSGPLRANFEMPSDRKPLSPAELRMTERLQDGYALSKFRFQTGEDTVCFYRGPLSPKAVPSQNWRLLSNSGQNLQILDKELGIMDITYSAAWQLGRTMAVANRAFTTALTRVRRAISTLAADGAQKQSLELAQMDVLGSNRKDFTSHMLTALDQLVSLSRCHETSGDKAGPAKRWWQAPGLTPDLSYGSQAMAQYLSNKLEEAAKKVASTTDSGPDNILPYDEYNAPYSPDWVLVLRFVLDLYHLIDIPLHYLLPDPAQLPAERLRFFVIDHNWVDALVDGALSLGNQGTLSLENVDEQPDDSVRLAIKIAIDWYFETKNSKLGYKPPVPHFGFFMRSNVVTQFPDLRISVSPSQGKAEPPLLLRHDVIGKDMMIGMFADLPGPRGILQSLTFTLPPHQQFFSAGRRVTSTELSLSYRRIYTEPGHDGDTDRNKPFTDDPLVWEPGKSRSDGRPAAFVWSSQKDLNDVRILLVENLAQDLYLSLKTKLNTDTDKTAFNEDCPTSAMLGMQLNASAWQLVLQIPTLPGVNRLLTYPTRLRDQNLPNITKWPGKEAVEDKTGEELETSARGLDLDLKPPSYRPLLPSEFLISTEEDPGYLEDRSSASESHRHSWASLLSQRRSSFPSGSSSSRLSFSSGDDIDDELRALEGGLPTFACETRPAANPQTTDIPVTSLRQDIVFSIIYKGDGNGFRLKDIVIDIPMKGNSADKWLMESYTANSATMVSNLRFNVRVTYSTETSSLQLLIIPRSTRGYVWVDMMKADVTDVSVVLNGVVVRKVATATDVKTTITPHYVGTSAKLPIDCYVNLRPVAKE